MNILAYLLCCHCIGDGILQNHRMQSKSQPGWDGFMFCTLHVTWYILPFLCVASYVGIQWWTLCLIAVQHWLQDRYQLHLKWMHWYGQTDVIRWPVGPLYVDQCWHVAFLMMFSLLN